MSGMVTGEWTRPSLYVHPPPPWPGHGMGLKLNDPLCPLYWPRFVLMGWKMEKKMYYKIRIVFTHEMICVVNFI